MQNNAPKVSILIPCYNSEKFLKESLLCCINQTYKNIEVVLVDDGSSDTSYFIALDFCRRYPNIVKVYQQPNLGACCARNLAFEKSTGDYIMYLDADDRLSLNKIEAQIELLKNEDIYTVSTCRWRRFFNDNQQLDPEPCKSAKSYDSGKVLLFDLWNHSEMFQTSCYLVHRELIEQVGPWLGDLKKNQDGEFFSRVLLQAHKVLFSNEADVFYRTGDYDSVSKDNSEAKVSALLYSFEQYMNNVLSVDDSLEARTALAQNFSLFRYLYNGQYPVLSSKAKQHIQELGVKAPICGTYRVRQISGIIGFENFLRLRKLVLKK